MVLLLTSLVIELFMTPIKVRWQRWKPLLGMGIVVGLVLTLSHWWRLKKGRISLQKEIKMKLDGTPQARVNLALFRTGISLELAFKRCLRLVCCGLHVILQNTLLFFGWSWREGCIQRINSWKLAFLIIKCVFYNRLLETFSHLFSFYLVTRRVWREVLSWSNMTYDVMLWEDFVFWPSQIWNLDKLKHRIDKFLLTLLYILYGMREIVEFFLKN